MINGVPLPRLLDGDLVTERARLHPVALSISETLSPLSTASMTLPEGETVALHDFVRLYTARGDAGVYRVASVRTAYTGETSVELEHGICVLGDALIPGEGTLSGTAAEVLGAMLAHQASGPTGAPLWTLGTVSFAQAVTYEHDYNNLLTALMELVDGIDSARMAFDQSAVPWKIHVQAMESTPGCEGRLGRNVRSASLTLDDSELCTRIYCANLPDPGYIDGPTVSAWGVVSKMITAAENVTQESLTSYINRYLEEHKNPRVSVEIDADELSIMTGETLDRFENGRLFRLALPDYGVSVEERIIAIQTGSVYGDPEHVRLSLANAIRDIATDFVLLDNSTTGGVSQNAAGGRGYYTGGGSGLTQTNLLDMLKKSEMRIKGNTAMLDEAWIELTAQGVSLNATKTAITGVFGDEETVKALLQVSSENGGLVAALVGRHTSTEDVEAYLQVMGQNGGLITMKASQTQLDETIDRVSSAEINIDGANASIQLLTGVTDNLTGRMSSAEIAIDGANAAIALKANQTTVDSLTGRVSTAESTLTVQAGQIESKVSKDGVISSINQTPESVTISASRINLAGYVTSSQLSAELANFQLSMNNNLTTNNLSVNSRAYLPGYVTMSSHVISMESVEVVTDVSYSMSGKFNVVINADTGATRAVNYVRSVSDSKSTIQYLKWN